MVPTLWYSMYHSSRIAFSLLQVLGEVRRHPTAIHPQQQVHPLEHVGGGTRRYIRHVAPQTAAISPAARSAAPYSTLSYSTL